MQSSSTRFSEIDYQTHIAAAQPFDQGVPQINGASVYGASPGKDFLYLIAVTGERPITFQAEGLPEGLILDREKGVIRGQVEAAGEYQVILQAENRLGQAQKSLRIVIGEDCLALTPPMGWNSWNCFRSDISQNQILEIAENMIKYGLTARGYSYVNLDSGWQSKKRGGKYNSILPTDAFPDMKSFCDQLHEMGLKAGIYSSPYIVPWGTDGCGTSSGLYDTNYPVYRDKRVGIEKHEAEDVLQWSEWGFDYLKYDWYHTDPRLAERMAAELRKSPRDFVFSVVTNVNIADAEKISRIAHSFRSNSDTAPYWASIADNAFSNDQWNYYVGPGSWFDLDMFATQERDGKRLNRNEMISHVTRWMIRPTPILLDCDPANIEDWLYDLLCNEEVIAVNQDPLGKPAAVIYKDNHWDIEFKPLEDGSFAIAFFNLWEQPAIAPYIGFEQYAGEKFKVRDLWAKKDLDSDIDKDFVIGVDAHCVKLFRVYPQK